MDEIGFRTVVHAETQFRPEGGKMVAKADDAQSAIAGYCGACGAELPTGSLVALMRAA